MCGDVLGWALLVSALMAVAYVSDQIRSYFTREADRGDVLGRGLFTLQYCIVRIGGQGELPREAGFE